MEERDIESTENRHRDGVDPTDSGKRFEIIEQKLLFRIRPPAETRLEE